MKHWLRGLLMGILVLALAACNSETPDAKPGTDAKPEDTPEEVVQEEELTVQEIFEKAQANSEEMKSMHATMDIDQNIKVPSEELDMDSKIKLEMDMIIEPLAMHQVMDMDMGAEGSAKIEIYMTEEGFFMKDPESEQWMKLPEEYYDELTESMAAGADPNLDLDSFEDFVEDFTVEEKDDMYILKLKASGEKFNALIQEELQDAGVMEGMDEETAAVLDTMEIHQFEYELFIDKETFNMNAFNMIMDMEMGEEEETVRIFQDMKADISKINEIDEIKVPQEILDNAVEQ